MTASYYQDTDCYRARAFSQHNAHFHAGYFSSDDINVATPDEIIGQDSEFSLVVNLRNR